ncbi:MAG: DUF4832 domain-containing protein [Burkholderiales bacterium]|nr:DUF4832 domain-containing protein [Burkholderiales bacterium]
MGNGNIGNGSTNSWASFTTAEQQQFIQIGREAGYRYRVDTGNIALDANGVLTVSATVRNDGNAPAYEPWDVLLELNNTVGTTVWSHTLSGDLRTSHGAGTSQIFGTTVQLPALTSGDYTLRLIARDGPAAPPRTPPPRKTEPRQLHTGVARAMIVAQSTPRGRLPKVRPL